MGALIQIGRIALAIVLGFIAAWLLFTVTSRLLPPGLLVPGCMVAVWFFLPRFVPKFKAAKFKAADNAASPQAPWVISNGPPLQMHTEGEWTSIYARSAPLPKRGTVIAVFMGAMIAVVFLNFGAILFGILAGCALTGLVLWGMHSANKSKRHANMGPFAVSNGAIRLQNGTVIERERIYRFGSRNTESGKILFYGGNTGTVLGNSMMHGSQVAAASTHRRMLPISYAVVVEHDGTLSWLAGGLTEELANAVIHEIVQRMDGFALTR